MNDTRRREIHLGIEDDGHGGVVQKLMIFGNCSLNAPEKEHEMVVGNEMFSLHYLCEPSTCLG